MGLSRRLLPLSVLLVWIGIRWTRRSLWLARWSSGEVPELERIRLSRESRWLFAASGFRFTAQSLRRHRRVPAAELDVKRSVEATVAQAGLFTPVTKERPVTPEYLFLIEQVSGDDHIARLADEALEQMEEEGVAIERYYFSLDRGFASATMKRARRPLSRSLRRAQATID